MGTNYYYLISGKGPGTWTAEMVVAILNGRRMEDYGNHLTIDYHTWYERRVRGRRPVYTWKTCIKSNVRDQSLETGRQITVEAEDNQQH
jgi:hypothetical protein